jgi:sugar-specific transcriptional regulator TrmB
MLINQLKKIGFSEKEALIYLQLVHAGGQSASTLAKKTRINRTTMYDILENLKSRGLIPFN